MQRKIGQRLRGARGATWLERSASLLLVRFSTACCYWWAVLAEMDPDYLRLDRGEKPCMVSDPLAESGHQQDTIFLGERVCEVSVIHYLEEMWACGADS